MHRHRPQVFFHLHSRLLRRNLFQLRGDKKLVDSLGSLYLNGKPELPKDPISAKYWIDKAAEAGYQDAVMVQELQWGDNPEGFVGWLAERLEKENKWRRWIGIGLIGLVVIAAIVFFFV